MTYEVLDPRFEACFKPSAKLEQLFDGCRWAEGPAYFPAHRSLVWSDIPNNRMLRYYEPTGDVGVFREPSEQCQRPHRRPAGPPGELRARRRGG